MNEKYGKYRTCLYSPAAFVLYLLANYESGAIDQYYIICQGRSPLALSGGILVSRDETLLQVKRAEEEAEQIIKEAQENQRAVVVAARKQAIRATQEADERLRAEFESTLSKERAKIAPQREAILSKGKDEALRTRAQAKDRTQKVKDHLKDSFARTLDATSRTNG